MSAQADKTPVPAVCGACKHEWPIAYLPMSVRDFCAVVGKTPRCPMCASKEVFVRTKDAELEREAK